MLRWWKSSRSPAATGRWLVVDVETSGLDPQTDRLLAIAAVALQVDWQRRRLAVDLADSFEVDIRRESPSSRENILLHGIGAARQSSGVEEAEAIRRFVHFAGASPLLAFHAAFDQALVGRAAREHGVSLPNPWLDIEQLCAVAHPGTKARSLDEWMAALGIRCAARHLAAADALAEAELMLRIWPRIAPECQGWPDLPRLAARHRWLARG